jgi:spore germination protein KC
MIKTVCKFLSFLILMLVLSGCWDQRQLDKRAYVYAIGMELADEDDDDDEENQNKFKITYLIVNPEYGSQISGSTNESPEELITFETHDLITSRNLANAVVAKEITYDLLRVFIVSEQLAKDKRFIRWMYDATKDREIRRDSYLVVSKEGVRKFLEKNKPKLETRADQYFDLILNRGMENGMIPESDLHRYFKITEADADLYLAIYGTTETNEETEPKNEEDQLLAGQLKVEGKTNQTQFLGSAVFKEGQMIGKLTGEETRIAVLLNDTLEMSDVLTTYRDPFNENNRIAARLIKKQKNDVKMKVTKKTAEINVTVPLIMEILSDHSMVNYGRNPAKRKQLKKHIEEILVAKSEEFVKKTQEEFKGEPFGWSLIARKEFLTLPEYEKFNWMKSYPNMKVNIKVNIRFGEFGRQGEVPSIEKVRD